LNNFDTNILLYLIIKYLKNTHLVSINNIVVIGTKYFTSIKSQM